MGADIRFPNLGITIQSLGKSFSIGSMDIAYYGLIIGIGMILGYLMATWQAVRLGQDKEIYLDLAIWAIVFGVIGARIYYIIFSWDYYRENPMEMFNVRGGGLAIYGGVIGGTLTVFVFSKLKKLHFLDLADTACAGLLVGQILGRWGNFFNREVFGGYTDNLFAMQIPKADVRLSDITTQLAEKAVTIDGICYIQVHPTFLYESVWNALVLLLVLFLTKRRKFRGQLFLTYLCGYGLGRFWIEGIRVDQLKLFHTSIPVSQLLSAILVAVSAGIMLCLWKKSKTAEVVEK